MFNLIHRHILREIVLSTLLAMLLFVFVLLMGNALKDIVELVGSDVLDTHPQRHPILEVPGSRRAIPAERRGHSR